MDAEVVIAGGGLAGSTAAAMLARAGFSVVMVDPHRVYPPDFRCEKLDGPQAAILRKTGLADAVLATATLDQEAWVARSGRLVDRRRGDQHGIHYDTLVNTMRAQIPDTVRVIHSKVEDISTGPDTQVVRLGGGEEIGCRLVVLANGLNNALRASLGMPRVVTSACHSVTIGFNVRPLGRAAFPFSSLTYYSERTGSGVAYLSLFPIGSVVRANFMVYRDIHDPWLEQLRENPCAVMAAAMPGLEQLTGPFEVFGHIKIRPADLYVTTGYERPGIVLVGDAFSTSCPAAGTGTGKVFTDVERPCNVYIPRWLATPGMAADKIAAFYADPDKRAYDAHARKKAYLLRSLSIDESWPWACRRGVRFAARWGVGVARRMRQRLRAGDRPHSAPATAQALASGVVPAKGV